MISIQRVSRLDLTIGPFDWPFRAENGEKIAQHFADACAAKPAIWNGRCLQCHEPRIEGEVFRARYFETDYATFLAWRDWNVFDGTVFHCFSAGALRSADGAFILGRMAGHTANAGRVYFPAGTPDTSDIVENRVDLAASVAREMIEETGLTAQDYDVEGAWAIIDAGRLKACYLPVRARQSAGELVETIRRNLSLQSKPELDDIVVVKSPGDFTDAMPDFTKAYIADVYANER